MSVEYLSGLIVGNGVGVGDGDERSEIEVGIILLWFEEIKFSLKYEL